MTEAVADLAESSGNRELAIRVENLSKTYRDGLLFRKKFVALDQLSLEVERGQIFGLLGPNGAGKTTFLKILLGIIRKSGGTASLLGFPAGKISGRVKVGYLPEHLRMPSHLTGLTALDYFGKLQNIPASTIREKRDGILASVGLADRCKDRVTKYSKGMLQRLGLAQALLHDPELLILDEPTDGLDPRARADMRAMMIELRDRGVTVFLNSHLLQEVELVCERVAILDRGKLRYCGPVDQIGDFVRERSGESRIIVTMELRGQETEIREALSNPQTEGIEISGIEALPDRCLVNAKFQHQADIDQVVDRLRNHDISIVRLSPAETTLEDAFLKIVSREPVTAAAS